MSFDFVNPSQATAYSTYGTMNPGYNVQQYQNPVVVNQPTPQNKIDPRLLETPTITTGSGIKFTIVDKEDKNVNIPVSTEVPDSEKKKVGRPRKDSSSSSGSIIRAGENTTVEEIPTAYSYLETTGMLRDTLGQIDSLNGELMREFEAVKANRTMKNKYNVLIGLSENVATLISNRISVVKEINSSIKNSNELDYKKLKDVKAANAQVDDDKYVADIYKSFISNPQAQINIPQMPAIDTTAYGSTGIVRANVNNTGSMVNSGVDASYLNYVTNASPEQRLMMYEGNNNVKQCIVYDASTGAKAFQYFDMSTMQPIPNMPVYSDMLLEEFTIDIGNKIAKSTTMKEQMPVIVINDNITSQY